jgi:hypothetical protein
MNLRVVPWTNFWIAARAHIVKVTMDIKLNTIRKSLDWSVRQKNIINLNRLKRTVEAIPHVPSRGLVIVVAHHKEFAARDCREHPGKFSVAIENDVAKMIEDVLFRNRIAEIRHDSLIEIHRATCELHHSVMIEVSVSDEPVD